MRPVDIVSHLDERSRLLTGGRRGRMERYQTLRAGVAWQPARRGRVGLRRRRCRRRHNRRAGDRHAGVRDGDPAVVRDPDLPSPPWTASTNSPSRSGRSMAGPWPGRAVAWESWSVHETRRRCSESAGISRPASATTAARPSNAASCSRSSTPIGLLTASSHLMIGHPRRASMTEHDPSAWLASIAETFDRLGVDWTVVGARADCRGRHRAQIDRVATS